MVDKRFLTFRLSKYNKKGHTTELLNCPPGLKDCHPLFGGDPILSFVSGKVSNRMYEFFDD